MRVTAATLNGFRQHAISLDSDHLSVSPRRIHCAVVITHCISLQIL
jgi:hypothetical protein